MNGAISLQNSRFHVRLSTKRFSNVPNGINVFFLDDTFLKELYLPIAYEVQNKGHGVTNIF
jgi:hypothetical protein